MALLLWVASWLIAPPQPAAAHPYHVTLAEAEINTETGLLEVSLRVLPEDLRRALEARGAKPAESGFDSAVTALLADTFTLTGADGRRQALRLVGKEVSAKAVWLYFELVLPEPLDGAKLGQRLLFDLEPTQINTVLLRQGEQRTTLTFTRQHPAADLAPPAPAAAGPSPR